MYVLDYNTEGGQTKVDIVRNLFGPSCSEYLRRKFIIVKTSQLKIQNHDFHPFTLTQQIVN